MVSFDVDAGNQAVRAQRDRLEPLYAAMAQAIVGQKTLVDRLIVGLLTRGHVLVEGVPGLAKTMALRSLARCLSVSFGRIQFTPDLLPADVLGTQIYNPRTGEFTVKHGPVFASLILADEINRAPAKVQSALLEAMQERQVTIGEHTFPLPEPFMVLATQNPIEHEGTYPLPEAQMDRFLMKLLLTYPTPGDEVTILERRATVAPPPDINPVLDLATLQQLQAAADGIYLDAKLKKYIVSVVNATRRPEAFGLPLKAYIQYGASPRGTIALALAAKAQAFLAGRCFVTPGDIKTIGPDVLRHRIILSYEAEADEVTADKLLRDILDHVPVE
jgi:MoxR-like ATPase